MVKCPHGIKIDVQDKYGVFYYNHGDEEGAECSQMGSFSIGVGTVLRTARHHTEDDNAKRAAFFNNDAIRNEVFAEMGKMDAEEMEEAIRIYFSDLSEVNSIRPILDSQFGEVLAHNIQVVHGFLILINNGEGKIKIVRLEKLNEEEEIRAEIFG